MNDRLSEAFEARLRRLEDVTEICQLISAYGPAADSENLDAIDQTWDRDCVYDRGQERFENRTQLKEGISKFHSKRSNGGSGHFGTMPQIVIEGDIAWATHHSALFLHEVGAYKIARISASRWTFARQASGGWLVTSRVNRPLDGGTDARTLFSSAAVADDGLHPPAQKHGR